MIISRGLLKWLGDPNRTDSEDLIVGGGEDGRVCVVHFATVAEGTIDYMAVQPERGDVIETRTVGGQGSEMPSRMWVSKDLAQCAARHFIGHGGRAPDVEWEFDVLDVGGAPIKDESHETSDRA